MRSSSVLQIRKLVNGVTTLLKSRVTHYRFPGVMREYTFSTRGNELHAFVDGQLVAATALDDSLPHAANTAWHQSRSSDVMAGLQRRPGSPYSPTGGTSRCQALRVSS